MCFFAVKDLCQADSPGQLLEGTSSWLCETWSSFSGYAVKEKPSPEARWPQRRYPLSHDWLTGSGTASLGASGGFKRNGHTVILTHSSIMQMEPLDRLVQFSSTTAGYWSEQSGHWWWREWEQCQWDLRKKIHVKSIQLNSLNIAL